MPASSSASSSGSPADRLRHPREGLLHLHRVVRLADAREHRALLDHIALLHPAFLAVGAGRSAAQAAIAAFPRSRFLAYSPPVFRNTPPLRIVASLAGNERRAGMTDCALAHAENAPIKEPRAMESRFTTVTWENDAVVLIDQLRLPAEEVYQRYDTVAGVAEAIRSMVVRGAPAIGVTAALGVALAAVKSTRGTTAELLAEVEEAGDVLARTRPTAVNLFWGIERMRLLARESVGLSPTAFRKRLLDEALAVRDEDLEFCRSIGRFGGALVPDGARILTHCNAGGLATAGYGTALGVIRGAVDAGKRVAVFADETRPFLQGARLTAWELHKDDIPVTLITDNMAGHLMQRGEIDLCVVGADRIAANGDTANKIGTYSVAVLAREHGLPFYVAAPLSTIDLKTPTGREIPIEERSSEEVLTLAGKRIAPQGVLARHPAFDVTPARLITAIITDRGVSRAPYTESLAALFQK